MTNRELEKQLNRLTKAKLPLVADVKLRLKLFILFGQKKFNGFKNSLGFKLRPVLAISLIFVLALVSLPVYAYASPKVNLANPLYPLKIGLEKIELKLASSDENQAKTLIKLADRRLAEADVLSKQNDVSHNNALAQTIDQAVELDQQAVAVYDRPEAIVPDNQSQVMIDQAHQEQIEKLNNIAAGVGINADEKVVDSVALALDNFKANNGRPKQNTPAKADNLPVSHKEIASSTNVASQPTNSAIASSSKQTTKADLIATTSANQINGPEIDRIDKTDKVITSQPNNPTPEESLNKVKQSVDKLKQDLSASPYEPGDLKILFERLDNKVNSAEQSLDKNKADSAGGIIRSTEALVNNAKIFLKKAKTDNSPVDQANPKNDNNGDNQVEKSVNNQKDIKNGLDTLNRMNNKDINKGNRNR